MRKKCVRTSNNEVTQQVKKTIVGLDPTAVFDLEGNPITFWVTTVLPVEEIRQIDGVLDAINANEFPKDSSDQYGLGYMQGRGAS